MSNLIEHSTCIYLAYEEGFGDVIFTIDFIGRCAYLSNYNDSHCFFIDENGYVYTETESIFEDCFKQHQCDLAAVEIYDQGKDFNFYHMEHCLIRIENPIDGSCEERVFHPRSLGVEMPCFAKSKKMSSEWIEKFLFTVSHQVINPAALNYINYRE